MEEFSGAAHKLASAVYNFLQGLGALDLVSWEAAITLLILLSKPRPAVLVACGLVFGGKAHC